MISSRWSSRPERTSCAWVKMELPATSTKETRSRESYTGRMVFCGAASTGQTTASAPHKQIMMNKMIVGNLVHRPIRSLISVIAVALEVTLILLIVGLSLGMVSDSRGRQAGIGADVVVMPPGSSYIVGLTGSPMSIKVGNLLAKIPHVVTVAPVVQSVSTQGAIEVIAGIDSESYHRLSGPFRYLQGGPFQSPSDCLVDEIFARSHHVKAGDTIEILNNKFRVAGVVEPGKGARKFLEIGVMQDLIGAQGKATDRKS